MTDRNRYPVLVITGPVGIGKTTTASALSELLIEHGVAHTLVDMDALTATWPRPPDDRFNERLGFRNLADIVRNGRDVGSARVIVSGVIESRDGRIRYVEAIPDAEVTVVRLVAAIDDIVDRLVTRNFIGAGSDAGLEWERHRAAELIAIMDAADAADFSIDTTDRTLEDVAREIGTRLGWLPAVS